MAELTWQEQEMRARAWGAQNQLSLYELGYFHLKVKS